MAPPRLWLFLIFLEFLKKIIDERIILDVISESVDVITLYAKSFNIMSTLTDLRYSIPEIGPTFL